MKTFKDFWVWLKNGNLHLQHEFHEIEWGDRWSWEDGEECRIWFPDKTLIQVYWVTVGEDSEDWAKAEHWEQCGCRDITDPDNNDYGKGIKWNDVFEKIQKYQPVLK